MNIEDMNMNCCTSAFGKDVELLERMGNTKKTVSLYIKFNKTDNCYVIVVSLHEQKYPISYHFK